MICPVIGCGADFEPSIAIHGLTVCPNGHSLVLETGERATSAETLTLSEEELGRLRAARKRPKRVAV